MSTEKRTETCAACGWAIREDALLALWLNEFGSETCGLGVHRPSSRKTPAAAA